jgi:hypothetical protein
MALDSTFLQVSDVESHVTKLISSEYLAGAPVRFEPNIADEFNSIGSRCILDRASALNIDPQKLVEPILEKLADNRFTSERGFLNFSDNNNLKWILSKEAFVEPKNLSIYILNNRLTTLSSMRLRLIATLQTYLASKKIQLFESFADESMIDNIIDGQDSEQIINIVCSHDGLPTKLFNKLVRAPAREQGRLSFYVVPKPYLLTKIIQWPQDYLDKVCADRNKLLSAAFYYSMPIQASDLDPSSCFLNENANLFYFGNRILSRLRSMFEIGDDQPNISNDYNAYDTSAVTWPIALLLKLLPLRLRLAVCRGEVFALTQGLYQLLTRTERILNSPDFRALIRHQKLTPIDQFIVNRLVNQLELIFNYESQT